MFTSLTIIYDSALLVDLVEMPGADQVNKKTLFGRVGRLIDGLSVKRLNTYFNDYNH